MTITLYWWMVPVGLALAGFGLWVHGAQQDGMMGGIVQFLFGSGLIVGALAACLVRLFA